jgi:hypothetical protein
MPPARPAGACPQHQRGWPPRPRRRRQGPALPGVTAPQQVKVAGQLTGSVHDAGHLTYDSHDGAVLMQGAHQRQRVEPDRVIGRSGASDIVGVIVTQPAPFPAGGHRTQEANSLFEPSYHQISGVTFQHQHIVA